MSKRNDKTDPMAMLRRQCKLHGQRGVGRMAHVSGAYVCMVLAGERPLTGKLAKWLGYEVKAQKTTTYEYRRERVRA